MQLITRKGGEMSQRNSFTAGLVALGVIVWTAAGCGSDASTAEADTSTSAAAIDNNQIDIDDPHRNAAVEINDSCSGTLITPIIVVTANHCVTGDNTLNITPSGGGWGLNTQVSVNFGVYPSSWDQTISTIPPAFVRQNSSISAPEDIPTDVAVVKLTSRPQNLGSGPHSVLPVHILEPDFTCEDGNVDNVIFSGYGRNNLSGGTSPNPRHYGVTDVGCSNPDCENSWPAFAYGGILPGDSGGPLFQTLNQGGTLRYLACGVASEYVPYAIPIPIPPYLIPYIRSEWARTTTSDNNYFILRYAQDKHGNWIGEPATNGPDLDGDGFTDEEDDCPTIYDPTQADQDGDGVGDVCDNCINTKNPTFDKFWAPDHVIQSDLNFDAEERANNPDPTGEPVPPIDIRVSGPSSPDYLTVNFPGDACDPNPLTATTDSHQAFSNASTNRTQLCTITPGALCGGSVKIKECSGTLENTLHVQEFVGAQSPTQQGITRAFACECPAGMSQAQCDAGPCSRDNVLAPSRRAWRAMTIYDAASGALLSYPHAPLALPNGLLPSNHWSDHPPPGTAVGPHVEDWGWAYWEDLTDLPPTPYTSVDGDGNPIPISVSDNVVWTWVRNFQPASQGPANPSAPVSPNYRLRQMVSRLSVMEGVVADQTTPPCTPHFPGVLIRDGLHRACPQCPQMGFLGWNKGDPNPGENMTFVSPGFAVQSAAELASEAFRQDLLNPAVDVVFASDTPDVAQGTAHGIVIDHATGAFLREVRQGQGNLIEEADTFGNAIPTGGLDDPPPPRVVAVSGFRQEVTVFGERDGNGNRRDSVRVYDFDLRTEKLWPVISRDKILDPVAATYRSEDDSYYLLDQEADAHHSSMRLLRFTRGLTVEVVATWPRARHFDNYGLTTAQNGDLVISAWSNLDHAIAILGFSGTDVRLNHLAFGRQALGVVAQSTFDGIDYAVIDSQGGMTPQREVFASFSECEHRRRDHHQRGRDNDEQCFSFDEHHDISELERCF